MNFGDIIYLKNIVFKNKDGSHEIDPYFSIGRPCVFIGEFEENVYFLPLTRIDERRDEKFFDIIIKPNKLNRLKKESKINFSNIIKRPISFFKVEGNISKKEIYEILKKSLTLYNCEDFDYSDIVAKLMINYIENNNITLLEKKNKGELPEKDNLSSGDIVLLKNIVFKDEFNSQTDHAFGSGRPCVFIGYKDDKMYFFPLSGFKPKHEYLFILNPNEENKLKKVSTISIKNIFELPIQSFQTIGNINEKKMLSIIKNFILYYDNKYDNINNKEICDRVYCIFNEILLLSKGRKVRKVKKIIKK